MCILWPPSLILLIPTHFLVATNLFSMSLWVCMCGDFLYVSRIIKPQGFVYTRYSHIPSPWVCLCRFYKEVSSHHICLPKLVLWAESFTVFPCHLQWQDSLSFLWLFHWLFIETTFSLSLSAARTLGWSPCLSCCECCCCSEHEVQITFWGIKFLLTDILQWSSTVNFVNKLKIVFHVSCTICRF